MSYVSPLFLIKPPLSTFTLNLKMQIKTTATWTIRPDDWIVPTVRGMIQASICREPFVNFVVQIHCK